MSEPNARRGRIPGFVIALLVVLLLGLTVQLWPSPAPSDVSQTSVQEKHPLEGRVFVHDLTSDEEGKLKDAIDYRFPGGSRVQPHVAFLVDFKPMSCGMVQPRGGALRRYIYGNGNVVIEGDAGRSDFGELWALCDYARR